ncbi:MAG: hypothetical protein P4L41_07130 [Flavipsychrobacter sp.]|nr:hypothetical protein [Flavipsychrobacter sp.]
MRKTILIMCGVCFMMASFSSCIVREGGYHRHDDDHDRYEHRDHHEDHDHHDHD